MHADIQQESNLSLLARLKRTRSTDFVPTQRSTDLIHAATASITDFNRSRRIRRQARIATYGFRSRIKGRTFSSSRTTSTTTTGATTW